jgi:hypothetical protein
MLWYGLGKGLQSGKKRDGVEMKELERRVELTIGHEWKNAPRHGENEGNRGTYKRRY